MLYDNGVYFGEDGKVLQRVEIMYDMDKWRLVSHDMFHDIHSLVAVNRLGEVIYFRAVLSEYDSKLGSNYMLGTPAKIHTNNSGYRTVNVISHSGKAKTIQVHRLVATMFVPGYFEGALVNHINGNPADNRAENLEWVTCSENIRHANRIGLVGKTKYIIDRNTGVYYDSAQEYMDLYGIRDYDALKRMIKSGKNGLAYAR